VIPNQKLLSIVDKNLGIKESFKLVDNILARAVGGMSSVLLSHGVNDINLDFADVQTVMTHKGLAILGVGEAEGENAAAESVKNAIESPLLDSLSLNGAMGVLVHFQINPNFPLTQIQAAMDIIYDSADEDADVIFGTTTNESFAENEVKITIVATGFTSAESVAPASANTPSLKPLTTPKEAQEEKQKAPQATTKRIKIGTTGDYVDDIDLDYPTFLRNQMD
jgi:cell division protein FtsZ